MRATIPQTAGADYAIRVRVYKENAAQYAIVHGNGTKRLFVYGRSDETIQYYAGGLIATGSSMAADTWTLFEIRNINFAAGTFDIVYNGSVVKSGATMDTSATYTDVIMIMQDVANTVNVWNDDFVVRKWTANDPAFLSAGNETRALFPSGIATAEVIGSHNLARLQTLLPDAIISAEALGNSKLILFLLPSAIDSGEAIGNPTLELFILPSAILTAEVVGDPVLGKYRLAGSVTLLGVGVSGAVIRAINQVTGECAEAATDIDGNYQIVLQANDAHHIAVEYENGQKYNALSKWDVVPA